MGHLLVFFPLVQFVSHGPEEERRMGAITTRGCLWLKINSNVNRWCRESTACQVSKVTKHIILEFCEISVPTRRFTEVNVNIVGPLRFLEVRGANQLGL